MPWLQWWEALTQGWKETLDGKSCLSVLFTLVLSFSLLHPCFILKRMEMLSEVLLPSEDLSSLSVSWTK